MKNPGYILLLLSAGIVFPGSYCDGQKDKEVFQDISPVKIPRVIIPVKTAKFQSNEVNSARTEYMNMTKAGKSQVSSIASLRQKGISLPSILATIHQIKIKRYTGITTISNADIAEDAQLMMKSIPNITAAEMITAIRDLYNVSITTLFNIALLTSQDTVQKITQSRQFTYQCDCKIKNPSQVNSSRPFRKSKTQSQNSQPHFKKLYPWECFDYWNTGFRSVVLPETNLNEFLRLMRQSQYPLYGGLLADDLADPSINFSVIMGTTAESLAELMECTTLAYLAPGTGACEIFIPFSTTVSLNYDYDYYGTCRHQSIIKTRFYLKDVLSTLKGNGFSVSTLATAAKTRFNPSDEDLKQRIIASFDPAVFSASEILQASGVINN